MTVLWHKAVEIDEFGDPFGCTICNAGRDHAAVAVTDQDNVAEVFRKNNAENVGDVGFEVDLAVGEVSTLAKTGEGRRENFMSDRL